MPVGSHGFEDLPENCEVQILVEMSGSESGAAGNMRQPFKKLRHIRWRAKPRPVPADQPRAMQQAVGDRRPLRCDRIGKSRARRQLGDPLIPLQLSSPHQPSQRDRRQRLRDRVPPRRRVHRHRQLPLHIAPAMSRNMRHFAIHHRRRCEARRLEIPRRPGQEFVRVVELLRHVVTPRPATAASEWCEQTGANIRERSVSSKTSGDHPQLRMPVRYR